MPEALVEARTAARQHIANLAASNPKIFCLDSDVGGLDVMFGEKFPDRYFDVGIAEANMISAAAGIAHMGGIPFVNSFAAFAVGRAFEQIKLDVCYANTNVKILASHSGLSAEHLGPTHHSIEDLALARTLPNLTVIVPVDADDAVRAVDFALSHQGPVLIRLGRKGTQPIPLPESCSISTVRQIKDGDDITLICMGPHPTRIALEAASKLLEAGLAVRVLNVATLKPLDAAPILEAAASTAGIITIEDHNTIGGLFSAVSEEVAKASPCLVRPVGIPDTFVEAVGLEADMLSSAGVDADHVVREAKDILSKSRVLEGAL